MRSRARQISDVETPLQPAPIDFLRTLAAGLRANNLDRRVALRASELLQCYFERAYEGWTLDDVFGVAVGRGEKSWLRAELLDRRNQSLRSIDRVISSPGWPMTKRTSALRSCLRTYKAFGRAIAAIEPHLLAAFEANRQLQALAESGGNSRLSGAFPMAHSTLTRALSDCSQ